MYWIELFEFQTLMPLISFSEINKSKLVTNLVFFTLNVTLRQHYLFLLNKLKMIKFTWMVIVKQHDAQ